jgi:predicted DNA-binding transcriptional regulator YafY
MKDDCFEVVVEFTGWAAQYAAERTWSPDQKISRIEDEKIRLTFSASSDVELIAWILSFGDEAKVIEPQWVADEILVKSKRTISLYE